MKKKKKQVLIDRDPYSCYTGVMIAVYSNAGNAGNRIVRRDRSLTRRTTLVRLLEALIRVLSSDSISGATSQALHSFREHASISSTSRIVSPLVKKERGGRAKNKHTGTENCQFQVAEPLCRSDNGLPESCFAAVFKESSLADVGSCTNLPEAETFAVWH
jgi:hypothetical protein